MPLPPVHQIQNQMMGMFEQNNQPTTVFLFETIDLDTIKLKLNLHVCYYGNAAALIMIS
jgi:hypothetical protein